MVYVRVSPLTSTQVPGSAEWAIADAERTRKVKAAVNARAALAKAKAAHHAAVNDAAMHHAHVAAMKPIWFRVRTDWGDLQVKNLLIPLLKNLLTRITTY